MSLRRSKRSIVPGGTCQAGLCLFGAFFLGGGGTSFFFFFQSGSLFFSGQFFIFLKELTMICCEIYFTIACLEVCDRGFMMVCGVDCLRPGGVVVGCLRRKMGLLNFQFED